MKTDGAKKSSIKIATQEQQENNKNTRLKLKDLQHSAYDKENLVGRARSDKDVKPVSDNEKPEKSRKVANKAVQTGEATITAEDLTSEEPSADYWKRLAEKRGDALNDSLQENDRLKEHIENLQEENRICKEMLDESKNLVEVLQEMLDESGLNLSQHNSTEIEEQPTETSSGGKVTTAEKGSQDSFTDEESK